VEVREGVGVNVIGVLTGTGVFVDGVVGVDIKLCEVNEAVADEYRNFPSPIGVRDGIAHADNMKFSTKTPKILQ
jgi:hypothetical protein